MTRRVVCLQVGRQPGLALWHRARPRFRVGSLVERYEPIRTYQPIRPKSGYKKPYWSR